MWLLVGLGNPGSGYARHRHNVGFMAVEEIARAGEFSPWKSKFQGNFAEGKFGRQKLLALKPDTYMNLSGQSVGEAMRFHKIEPATVVVFHRDCDLDLAKGKVRVKVGGGHGGHNGLRSIDGHVAPIISASVSASAIPRKKSWCMGMCCRILLLKIWNGSDRC